jgi:phenylpyruvate tautomerase PptA (4-oxalocrotonate tautomerase family)
MTVIVTKRPPLNLFDVVRVSVDDTATEIYEVPSYEIPAEGPNAQRDIDAAAILTNMIVANTTAAAAAVTIWIEDADSNQFFVAQSLPVAEDGYIKVDLDKQIMQSREKIFCQMATSETAEVHLSFVLNQREEFTVITP